MKAVIQRVSQASVAIGGTTAASISKGLIILLGIAQGDTGAQADYLASKIASMRIFTDHQDKMNLSLLDVDGCALVVSNFTLCADPKKSGNRPSFSLAARPEQARPLYESFAQKLRALGVRDVQTGEFGADMQVSLVNDGPVTIVWDTQESMKNQE